MDEFIRQYLDGSKRLLGEVSEGEIARVMSLLLEANQSQRHVFIMGNGGSAATASHFACDLGKGTIVPGAPRFAVTALNDNVPLMTAWANDTAYENIFAEQLDGLIRGGDVVIGISCSGKSANVLNAVRLAAERSAVTVGFTGFDGGTLKDLADISIHVPSSRIEQVEDVHLTIAHLMCSCIRETLRHPVKPQLERELEAIVAGESVPAEPDD